MARIQLRALQCAQNTQGSTYIKQQSHITSIIKFMYNRSDNTIYEKNHPAQ